MKQLKILVMIAVGTLLFISHAVHAKVTGSCANCHTMHNSQNGSEVVTDPQPALTVNNCVGCHSSNLSSTTYTLGDSTVPVVNALSEPVAENYLAGGNFYWVAQGEDSKGHNVFLGEGDDDLAEAPGAEITCGSTSCHNDLSNKWTGDSGLHDKYGCQGCHLNVAHHADDGDGDYNLVNSANQGWYRFLSGHNNGAGNGVIGLEDSDWQATNSPSDHNEYLGKTTVEDGGWGFNSGFPEPGAYTTTAFCTGCHGIFHSDQKDGASSWIRHPADAVLPTDAQYSNYNNGAGYNPIAPVARDDLTGYTAPNSVVTAGSDMVMCLSCHRPHGSPYDDILRWDYSGMNAGGGGADGTGCFVCHTNKDGS
ncbi:MAG: cytochrome c3 family protein [Pseudomonadota bacterium]